MATTGFNGRQLTIDWASTTLVGIRTRSYTVTNDYVDVTTDDDEGWRKLLDDPATRSVEVTVGGITGDQTLLSAIMAANVDGGTVTVNLPTNTGASLSGDFMVSSYEGNGEHDGAYEFSATFMSNGSVTYTEGT